MALLTIPSFPFACVLSTFAGLPLSLFPIPAPTSGQFLVLLRKHFLSPYPPFWKLPAPRAGRALETGVPTVLTTGQPRASGWASLTLRWPCPPPTPSRGHSDAESCDTPALALVGVAQIRANRRNLETEKVKRAGVWPGKPSPHRSTNHVHGFLGHTAPGGNH